MNKSDLINLSEKAVAIVRLRGMQGVRYKISNTLKIMKLKYINTLIFLPFNKQWMGRVKLVKDYVTYCIIDNLNELSDLKNLLNANKLDIPLHLHPPKGGHKRIDKRRKHGVKGSVGLRNFAKFKEILIKMQKGKQETTNTTKILNNQKI